MEDKKIQITHGHKARTTLMGLAKGALLERNVSILNEDPVACPHHRTGRLHLSLE